MAYVVEIDEGAIALSAPFEPINKDLLLAHLRAREAVEVELPDHPIEGTQVVAYRAAHEKGLAPNCRIPGRAEPIHGVLVIAGLDASGEHRFLSLRETRVYRLEQGKDDEVPTLVIEPPSR